MPKHPRAFTLIELLVVVAIIALLIGILLPSLAGAKDRARATVCGTNLRAIAQGLATYESDWNAFPAAYYYKNQLLNSTNIDDSNGYIHWSSFLYSGDNSGLDNASAVGRIPAKAFLCPAFIKGGLPPTNPGPNGQPLPVPFVSNYPGITDQQAPLISYTVNEAICGRNKWVPGVATGNDPVTNRPYRFVHLAEIQGAGTTILATEFTQNPLLISSDNGTDSGSNNLKTHRPVSAYTAIGPSDPGNLFNAAPGGFKSSAYGLQRTKPGTNTYSDLQNNKSEADYGGSRLAWVGRNHGTGSFPTKKSNFAFVDGHVELKTIFNTLTPGFEWGDQVYSLEPGTDFQP